MMCTLHFLLHTCIAVIVALHSHSLRPPSAVWYDLSTSPPHLCELQATYTRETSERILLHSYVHAAVSPLAKAYAIAASYPYNINTPAILDAVVKRVAEL